MARPAHRPTKYRPEMCEEVIELLRDGYSLHTVALKLDVDVSNMRIWAKKIPDFHAAINKGLALSQGWWEGKGRDNLENRDFNFPGWFMQMKNRFKKDWRDQHEVAHTGADGGPIQLQAFPQCKTPQEYIEWQKEQQPPELKLIK